MTGVGWLRLARRVAQVAVLAAVPALGRAARPWGPVVLPPAAVDAPVAPVPANGPDSLAYWLISRDPFRPARTAAPVAYDPSPLPATPPEPPPPKPVLAVSGLVWGAEPSAVVEGLPGQEGGRLVRAGEVVAGLRIRRITPTHVTITGMDTTWVLEVRRPW